jgi:very-short-patch-repair endonuclease
MALPRELADQAETQFGVIARYQLLEGGMSSAAITRRLNNRELVRLYRRVYRMAGAPPSLNQTLMAAQVWAGPGSALLHRSAAWIAGLDGVRPGLIEVTTPRRTRPPSSRWRVHYDANLRSQEIETAGPFAITGTARTILDLGAVLPPQQVELAMEDGLRKLLTNWDELVQVLIAHAARGRNGVAVLRGLLELANRDSSVSGSGAEVRLFRLLRNAGLPKPTKQHRVHREDGHLLAEVDFAYPAQRIAIEFDSYRFHSCRAAWEANIERRNQLTAYGWIVIHVTWRKLTHYPDLVVKDVHRALALRLSATRTGLAREAALPGWTSRRAATPRGGSLAL